MKDRTTGGGGRVSPREKAKGNALLMYILYFTALAGMGLGNKGMQNVSIMERLRIGLAIVTYSYISRKTENDPKASRTL